MPTSLCTLYLIPLTLPHYNPLRIPQLVESLTDKQVKKQEHIYELIITEKHHCRMLKVMQKVA